MSRLHIDFAPRQRRLAPWLALAIVGLVAWALYLLDQQQKLAQAITQTHAQIARLGAAEQARRNAPPPPEPSVAPERAAAVNAAIAQLNVPWTEMLATLEQTRPPTLALLVLEPNAAHGRLRVLAEADTADELLAYADAVAKHPPYVRYTPLRQEEVVAGGRSRLHLNFELEWTR